MGTKNSCLSRNVSKNEDYGTDVQNKDCSGTNAGTVTVQGNINNYFPPTNTDIEKKEDHARAQLDMQEMLKSKYINIHMPPIPWYKRLFLPIENFYTQLEMGEYCTSETDSVRSIELMHIFEPIGGSLPYRILVEGSPGYGKTTLSLKLAFDWARNSDYLSKFDLVFLIQLRNLMSPLQEAILQVGKVGDMSVDTVRAVIEQNSEKVLLILDGFDELPEDKMHWILPILESKVYPRMTVVLTSRKGFFPITPESSNAFMQSEFMNIYFRKQIRITGIMPSQQSDFLKKCFPDCCDVDLHLNYQRIVKLIPDLRQDIFECPLFLLLMVLLAEDQEVKTPETKTDLYKAIFNFIIKRSFYKDGTVHSLDIFHTDPKNISFQLELLKKFGKLSLRGIQARKLIFTEEEILTACGNDARIFSLGFITKNVAIQRFYSHEYYELTHKSFLEFLAAVHLWLLYENGLKDEFESELRCLHKCFMEYGQLVLPFLCGLLMDKASAIFHALEPYAFMYHDIRPFESILTECDPTEEFLVALESFIPTRWEIPGFYDEWFSHSKAHSKILNHGIQVGRITTIEWDMAHTACLPQKFEIPCMILIIEDLTSQLNEMTFAEITCCNLILDFRYAPADNVLNNWNSLMLLLRTHFKPTNVLFNMGYNTDALLPLLFYDVSSGNNITVPLTLSCSIEESMEVGELLLTISDLIGTGTLRSLGLTLSLWDMTDHIDVLNQLIHKASQAVTLEKLEVISLTDCPIKINFSDFQSSKQWKGLKLSNSLVFYAPDVVSTLQTIEIDYLTLDSIPDTSSMVSAMEFFRVKVLECEDDLFLKFILQHSENFKGYKSIQELILKVDGIDNQECFTQLTKLQFLEKLSLVMMSYEEDEPLLSTSGAIITSLRSLKLKTLHLQNVQRNIQFTQCLLNGLFDATQLQPKNCADFNAVNSDEVPNLTEAECVVLKELTLGYDKSLGKLGRSKFGHEKEGATVYFSLLNGLKTPLTTGQLQRLNIVFEKNIQKKDWIETLGATFPQSERFSIDFEYGESTQNYSIHCS